MSNNQDSASSQVYNASQFRGSGHMLHNLINVNGTGWALFNNDDVKLRIVRSRKSNPLWKILSVDFVCLFVCLIDCFGGDVDVLQPGYVLQQLSFYSQLLYFSMKFFILPSRARTHKYRLHDRWSFLLTDLMSHIFCIWSLMIDNTANIWKPFQQPIKPLKSELKERKRRRVTQGGATGVYQQGEGRDPDWCFNEVVLTAANSSDQ